MFIHVIELGKPLKVLKVKEKVIIIRGWGDRDQWDCTCVGVVGGGV